MNKQEQQDYDLFLEKLTVTQESLEATRMDALEKGILIGEEKGIHLKARSAAIKMIHRGFNNEDIADITSLPFEEIEALRQELN